MLGQVQAASRVLIRLCMSGPLRMTLGTSLDPESYSQQLSYYHHNIPPLIFLFLSFQYVHNLSCYLNFHHLLLSQAPSLPKHLLCSPH